MENLIALISIRRMNLGPVEPDRHTRRKLESLGNGQREDGDLPAMLRSVLIALLSDGLYLAQQALEFVDLQYKLNDVVNFVKAGLFASR